MSEFPRVKICGVTRREDALAVDRSGADYLGVILSDGFSRSVDPRKAHAIVDGVAPVTVAVLVGESPESAEAAARSIGAGVIQLHGEEPPGVLADLRTRGSWKLWKAVRAGCVEDIERAVERYEEVADGFLVEGWKKGVTGGGGVRLRVDPSKVRALIPEGLDFILAGGLTPDGVTEAVWSFRPDVVDVSSGVESTVGKKDHDLVSRFVAFARGASTPRRAGAHATREVES